MSERIAVAGLGVVGAFGTGRAAFVEALSHGAVDAEPIEVGPTGLNDSTYPALRAHTDGVGSFVNPRLLRRVDRFSQLAILGAGLALEDADLLDADRSTMGIALGTGYGASATTCDFMDSMVDFGDACASPTKFSNSVHNSAAANVAITMKLQGANLTVSQFEMSVPMALVAAVEWLRDGLADTILLGGVDEFCRPLGYCYHRYFGDHPGGMSPLDTSRQTAIPGEGAAFLVLATEKRVPNPRAFIDSVSFAGQPDADVPLILGADGHVLSGRKYQPFVESHNDVRCFSAVHGSLPSSPAFEMAAGVTLLANGAERVQCLKIGCGGDTALISLSAP